MKENYVTALVISAVIVFILRKIFIRLRLSRAKHPSLRGHSKWSRRISRLIPYFAYDEEEFFSSDGAPVSVVRIRKQALEKIRQRISERSPESLKFYESMSKDISDVQFTSAYKVPFPYRDYLSKELKAGSIVTQTKGTMICDLDGNWNYDLSGSYGVNVFGYDFYKECMQAGFERVKDLGPVLGPYHPVIKDNVERIKAIAGLDEVSFHMSGTEAVMQAVRLARYHTGKTHLVRFCGAYHGWWDGVQPGIGNQRKADDIYTLTDVSDISLKVLRTRDDIACVLINPLQALHPNSDAASDASLINSSRAAHFDRKTYSDWLKKIREVCTKKNIVLIFDEVFTGFRLAYRGAQEYFGVQADMVTYGKTLGGGLPVGVVCGRHHLMKRYRDDVPVDISFARGTFNSHPYVMACMNEFLLRIETEDIQSIYKGSESLWNDRVDKLNTSLEQYSLPVRVVNMHTIWTIVYTLPGRYNWMFQFYLRAEGLELSWVGSGRMILSFNYTDEDFENIVSKFIAAANKMNIDGWWWQDELLTNKTIKRMMLKDILRHKSPFASMHSKKPLIEEAPKEIKEG